MMVLIRPFRLILLYEFHIRRKKMKEDTKEIIGAVAAIITWLVLLIGGLFVMFHFIIKYW